MIVTFYKKALQEQTRLETQIASVKSQINSLPKGNFFCAKNGKYYKWYHTDGKHQTVIPKKQRKYAESLAQRKYLLLQLEELKKEKGAIDIYIANYRAIPHEAEQLFHKNDEYERLISAAYIPQNTDFAKWAKEPYPHNTKHPEQLIHKTVLGNYVRSKSETIISMFLFSNQIPFRYECELQLSGTTFYPDFTICHPRTGEIYYWEHFGMMDDRHYSNNAFSKLQLYISNGIIPNVHLITTYETKDCPLDSEQLTHIIDTYFK